MIKKYAPVLMIFLALNLADAASTHLALRLGIAEELNPIMRWAYGLSPGMFWVVKMSLVSSWAAVARRYCQNWALSTCNAIYVMVLITHAIGWVGYLSR